MTRIEREQLVERYLQGGMDFSEEENFFIQVALDDELRRTLKSYRIVEDAIRKEREAGSYSHVSARRAVAGILVLSPESEPVAQQPEEFPQSATVQTPNRWRQIVAGLAAAGILLFGWMIFNSTENEKGVPAQTMQTTPVTKSPQPVQPLQTTSPLREERSLQGRTLTTRKTQGPVSRRSDARGRTERNVEVRTDSAVQAPPRQDQFALPIEIEMGENQEK